MLDRIMGVVMLKAATYRQIADDTTATGQAAMVFIISKIIQGFFQGLVVADPNTGGISVSILGAIFGLIVAVVIGLIGWYITAWVLAFVAERLGGKTNTQEMLRVTGYVEVFGVIAILTVLAAISPVLACIVGIISFIVGILRLIGYIIGVREAAEFTTGNAIITAVIAAIVNFIIVVVIGGAILLAFLAVAGVAGAVGGR